MWLPVLQQITQNNETCLQMWYVNYIHTIGYYDRILQRKLNRNQN